MEIKEIVKVIEEKKIENFSLRICDLDGRQVHFTIPVERFYRNSRLDTSFFENGVAFDGSSIEGFKSIEQSDLLAVPDIQSAVVDNISKTPTLVFHCNLIDPEGNVSYWLDPRAVAKRAEKYLIETGIADTAFFGLEIEFFLFDSVKWKIGEGFSYHNIASAEGGIGEFEDIGDKYKIRPQEGYLKMPPFDQFKEIRDEMVKKLKETEFMIERDTHERATAGSAEIDIKYQPLLKMADQMLLFKYLIRNVAASYHKMATFMPKPLRGHNGNGMHLHHSLWKEGKPLFYDPEGSYYQLSKLAMQYLGGILTHAKSLSAITSPSVNSYKRLVPGFEAPTTIAFGYRNRSTCIRIPAYPDKPEAKRIEFRIPDPSTNPYLCFAAIMLAGIDGVKRRIDPVKAGFGPLEKNGYDLVQKEKEKIQFIPGSLDRALNELEKDHAYLLRAEFLQRNFLNYGLLIKEMRLKK